MTRTPQEAFHKSWRACTFTGLAGLLVLSGCTEAGERVLSAQVVLKVAADWDSLLASQLQVLDDAATLEREACLSPGFTSKLTEAYRDSVRPRGVSLRTLFDRWTSDP